MKKRLVKITAFFFAVFLFCMSLVPIVGAEEFKNPMLDTYICDDLNTYGFRLSDYPADTSSKRVSLMHLQEYGFHKDGDPRYYDLYVYVYNPSCNAIETSGNYIQLAFGESKNYKKYPLEILSHSVDDENENLFYKFKVSAIESFNKTANRDTRKYFISGIELNFRDDSRDDDYPVSQEWTYSGYQYNFGSPNPAGSLVFNVKKLETVKIDLHGARWFSATSDYGEDFRYEVSSVYFAIPNDIIRKYGNLKDKKNGTSGLVSVQGSYNKYGLNGLIVESEAAYNEFMPVLNKSRYQVAYDLYTNKYSGTEKNFWTNLCKHWPSFQIHKPVLEPFHPLTIPIEYYNIQAEHYNNLFEEFLGEMFGQGAHNAVYESSFHLEHLMLLSKGSSPDISKGDLTQLWKSSGKPCHLTPNTLYIGPYIDGISKDLHYYDIKVTDGNLNSQIKSFASSEKGSRFYHKFVNKLLTIFGEDDSLYGDKDGYPDCEPIIELKDNFLVKDFFYTKESMCDELFLSKEDVSDLKSFYLDKNFGNHVYLMRFAVDPYYSREVRIGTNIDQTKEGQKGWYYEKVIYDNFDVLSFTFQGEDGGICVVPVNCKPTSIIGSVVPGDIRNDDDTDDDLSVFDIIKLIIDLLKKLKIFPILMGILLLVIIFKVIWPIFKKLGNAGLDVAKARASRPKNENRDKSPPKGEEKDKSPPEGESKDKSKKVVKCKNREDITHKKFVKTEGNRFKQKKKYTSPNAVKYTSNLGDRNEGEK